MNSLSRKLNGLEQNVLDLPDDKEIILYINDDAEMTLHEKAEQIKQKYREDAQFLNNPELTFDEICSRTKEKIETIPEQELTLINKSCDFVRYRLMRLVYKHFEDVFGQNKQSAWMRIVWFFCEMEKSHVAEAIEDSEFNHNRNEDDPEFDDFKWWALVDEKVKLLYPEGVFTEKSWEKCRNFFDKKEAEFLRKYYEDHPEEFKELMERLK